jgi:hypothetical protein
VAGVAGKVLGSLAIGLGGIFLILDGIQMYKDRTAKSIGESIEQLADEISILPTVK